MWLSVKLNDKRLGKYQTINFVINIQADRLRQRETASQTDKKRLRQTETDRERRTDMMTNRGRGDYN